MIIKLPVVEVQKHNTRMFEDQRLPHVKFSYLVFFCIKCTRSCHREIEPALTSSKYVRIKAGWKQFACRNLLTIVLTAGPR